MSHRRSVWSRFAAVPFEMSFGCLAVISGLAGLFGFGMGSRLLRLLFSHGFQITFYSAYLVAGLLILFGLGAARARIEAVGIVWLGAVVAVQAILFIAFAINRPELWEDVAIGTVFYLVMLAACLTRLRALLRHEKLVRVEVGGGNE
ncbi:MAG TPA: hypothetical protein VFQ40_08500 [Actinomycetota bacterium]|nr:hypothetical protein [Actinomycetota bacterium]